MLQLVNTRTLLRGCKTREQMQRRIANIAKKDGSIAAKQVCIDLISDAMWECGDRGIMDPFAGDAMEAAKGYLLEEY